MGDKKAPITLIAFEDFGCDHCKQQFAIFDELLTTYPGKIKIVWKGLPVTRFPVDTRLSHAYSYCMNQHNKFDQFKRLAFANSTNLTRNTLNTIVTELGIDPLIIETCMQSDEPETHLKQVEAIARTLNIQAVPAIFKDGVQLHAPGSAIEWAELLELN